MTETIGWRRAGQADVGLLEDLRNGFLREDPLPETGGMGASPQVMRDFLEHPEFGGIWIIEVGGKAAGYAVLCLGWSLEWRGMDAFLDELFVVPEWRCHGVGAKTVDFVSATAKELGARALHLEAHHSNPRAAALYERIGFTRHPSVFLSKSLG